jgi:hypothetical protein
MPLKGRREEEEKKRREEDASLSPPIDQPFSFFFLRPLYTTDNAHKPRNHPPPHRTIPAQQRAHRRGERERERERRTHQGESKHSKRAPQQAATQRDMGWWPFGGRGGGDLSASKLPDSQQQQKKQAAAGVTTAATAAASRAASAAAADPALAAVARPTSVFAFGPTVSAGGEVLRGMCAGDDPDAIQACTWTIEKAEASPRPGAPGAARGGGKMHAYVVEF